MIRLLKQLLDWIYSRKCCICRKASGAEEVCKDCLDEIEENFLYPYKVIHGVEVYSASTYSGNIKKLIRNFKYHKKKQSAEVIARILYNFWQKLECSKEDYELVPVPLFYLREQDRGYNQVLLIAKEFSKLSGYKVNNDLVKRVKNTMPHYKLSGNQRMENVKDAFTVNLSGYNNKKLLIMDDICTTGATVKEIVRTLYKSDIKDLCGLVVANP